MDTLEIVGAIIGGGRVTSDPQTIDAALALKKDVRYITRSDARRAETLASHRELAALAHSPTLFVTNRGVRYRQSD